jgi:hypothetical protein
MNTARVIKFPTNKSNGNMESKDTSFVLLSRSLKTCSFKRNPERVALWVHLILDANYTDKLVTFNGSTVERKRGQVITSRRQLAYDCGLTESEVKAALKAFEKEEMITVKTVGKAKGYTVITLLNYDVYQPDFEPKNSTKNDKNYDPSNDPLNDPSNDPLKPACDKALSANYDPSNDPLNDPSNDPRQYKEILNKTPIVPFGDSQSADAELPDAGDKKKSSSAKQPVINYQAFADSYNEILGDRLPTCAVMNDKRKRALKKLLPLLKAPTLECFSAYLNAFAHTARPFYFGDNDRGWRASFDFVLRQDTLTATKEGSIADSRLEIEGDDE